MKDPIAKAIEEHRIAVTALTVRAMNLDNDGEQIRRELDEADRKLRAFIDDWPKRRIKPRSGNVRLPATSKNVIGR